MNKKMNKLSDVKPSNPFTVPDGYFDNLAQNVLSSLPERVSPEAPPRTLWQQMQPFVYMAAMFAGIALMIRIFIGDPDQVMKKTDGLNLTSEAEIEEFYQYYEDQLVSALYREAFYISSGEE